ncbi:MAG: glycosyltransferase family 2 protein [Deinococcota bacterium]
MNNPVVSFVFPTRNRRELVRELLTKLHDLPGPSREIIVVDDASKDDTWDMIQHNFPEVRGFRNDVQSSQDNLYKAVEMAKGDYIFKLDDDAYPAEDTLEKVITHFETRGSKLGLVALPIFDAKSGRLGYTTYFPDVPEGQTFAPTRSVRFPGAVFRREALANIPISPHGYFRGGIETGTVFALRDAGYEADFLATAPVYHYWVGRPRNLPPETAFYPFRNDLVTISRCYHGWRRSEMIIGRYLAGLFHLTAAGRPQDFARALKEASEMLETRPAYTNLSDDVLEYMYPCFDGVTLLSFFSKTNFRRLGWFLGLLPIDQTC